MVIGVSDVLWMVAIFGPAVIVAVVLVILLARAVLRQAPPTYVRAGVGGFRHSREQRRRTRCSR